MEMATRKLGQYRPMLKSKYLKHLEAIRAMFPWVNGALLRPAPGHMSLVMKLLNDLELMLGKDVGAFIPSMVLLDDNGRLAINFSTVDKTQLHKEVVKSIYQRIQSTCSQSVHFCAICGDPQSVKSFCRRHNLAGYAGLRYAEQVSRFSFAPQIMDATSRMRSAIQFDGPKVSIHDLPPLPGEPNFQTHLQIKLFDPASLSAVQKRSESLSSEQRARLRTAIERMKAAGADGLRRLGVFKDGAGLAAEFIDRFPNFTCLGGLIAECAALYKLSDNRVKLPPILLVGPAGVGKTEAASYLANALSIGFKVIDMASTQTSSPLSGSDAMWSNSQEGSVFKALCYEEVANPIILLDEIDKISSESRYDPMGPLYSLLEVTSARRFQDQSLKEVTLDASHINWIATANDISVIPKPILSRFVVFEIEPPSPAQARVIARNIYKGLKAGADWGTHFGDEIDEVVIDRLVLLPPRGTRVALQRAFGAAAKAGRKALMPEDIFVASSLSSRGFGFMSEM